MRNLKEGLWYQCKKSFREFEKGYYYYCPDENLLNVRGDKQAYVWTDERKNFVRGIVIKIAEPKR